MSAKRTLYIVRHAKSSWDVEGISDIDRPLKLRGVRAAYEMARRIKIEQLMPDLIITSPANRALHTAIIFHRVFEKKFSAIKIDERLYGTGTGAIKKVISEQPDDVKRIMVVGHNPDFSDLATMFSGNSFIELPTCGVCRVTFSMDKWSEMSSGKVTDSFIDFPKKGVEA
jgi:phosphohistidine phosphatase